MERGDCSESSKCILKSDTINEHEKQKEEEEKAWRIKVTR